MDPAPMTVEEKIPDNQISCYLVEEEDTRKRK
jgi:hypothetical protein